MFDVTGVTLRPVDIGNRDAVLSLRVADEQTPMVASVEQSLAQVACRDSLRAFAMYDDAELGALEPASAPIGFLVVQVDAGLGFILRLMVDIDHQRQGYGRAALQAATRLLQRVPDVEMLATSYRPENYAMAELTASLGFSPWRVPWSLGPDAEVYVKKGLPSY